MKNLTKKIKMTIEKEQKYQDSQDCQICKQKVNTDKVRDHCHITSKYRDATHKKCNSKLQIPRKLAIIFHNL